MSETNLQLFPGVFRSTVGGANPGFFLHSDGRVGIGNQAPTNRPLWSSNNNDRNKLNVSGHTHIDGNLQVTGQLFGDGSTLDNVTAVIVGSWLTDGAGGPQPADIKYDLGNVGIGGAASANKLKVYGTIEATSFIASGTINLDASSSIRQDSTTWTGNPGTQGKLEYHDRKWYVVGGSNSNELALFRRDGSDRVSITNEGNLLRRGHSYGYLIGSYNSVGANDTKTNPIYTIGTSYMPSDTSLGDMHGIGYSHNNFTSMLTGGWGMYVAADGDVRIGLNGSHGHIKNSGHIYCGGTVHLSGSTSQGLRSVTGQFGTVQTTGGGTNGWEGYSIDGRYVFMSSNDTSCGIYNDLDNDWMIKCHRSSYVTLYNDGHARFRTGNPNFVENNGLRIYGVEHSQDYTDSQHDYWQNYNQIQADRGYTHFGLYVDNAIRTSVYVALSDRRIKKDFLEIDDTIALGKLRQLKPTSYKYKDKWRGTTDRVLGFIAQEVAEVLPDAVSITNAVIPNIQIEASVKKIDEEKFEFTLKEPYVVTVGSKLELKGPKIGHMEVEVISVTDDTTFTGTAEDFDIEKVGDRVIVYGEYVDDFHNLDKNAIFTVATAALQEVDRQLQAEKEKVKSLEERLAALEAIVLNQ